MVTMTDDKTLSPEQKTALVIHELRLLNALPEIPPLLLATWPFPGLNSNDLSWLERKRKDGTTDWPWFQSAINFLNGEGAPQSDFEKVRVEFLEQLDREINECRRISTPMSDKHPWVTSNEQRKEIGGPGSILGNVNGTVPSIWDKVDSNSWREQK